jgi:hypothetical protein
LRGVATKQQLANEELIGRRKRSACHRVISLQSKEIDAAAGRVDTLPHMAPEVRTIALEAHPDRHQITILPMSA